MRQTSYIRKLKSGFIRSRLILNGVILLLPFAAPLVMSTSTASASQSFSEYPAGSTHPVQIVTSGGSMWYVSSSSGSVPVLSNITTSGTVTGYNPFPAGDGGNITGLTTDASGNVWFSGCDVPSSGGQGTMILGYMDPSTNAITTFHYSGYVCRYAITNYTIGQLTVDATGHIWVAMYYGTSTGHSFVAEFGSSGTALSGGWSPTGGNQLWDGIVVGPGNSLWTVDNRYGKVAQLTLSPTTGTVTGMNEYAAPGSLVGDITVGPDGNLWVGGSGVVYKMTTGGAFTSYTIPSGTGVNGIAAGPDGALWFTGGSANNIGRATTEGSITEYTIPTTGAAPSGITSGPDNAMWFTEYGANQVGRISAAPSVTAEYSTTGTDPRNMVTAGGSTWYLNSVTGASNRDTLSSVSTSGVVTNYSLVPSGGSGGLFNGIAVDSSGNIWSAGCFVPSTGPPGIMVLSSMNTSTLTVTTHTYSGYVCRYGITNYSFGKIAVDASDRIWVDIWNSYVKHNGLAKFTTSGAQQSGWAQTGTDGMWSDLIYGPNNSLWATDSDHNQIHQFTLSPTTGAVTGENIYTSSSGTPYYLAVGSDGNIWFVEDTAVGKMTPTGTFTYYTVPSGGGFGGIASGSDGAVWFTETTANKVGRITTTGGITEYPVSTSSSAPLGITAGPDGAVWFTEYSANKIGRIGY